MGRMGNSFYFVSAGTVVDPEEERGGGHEFMLLPWGTGQGIFPGAPAGDPFWSRNSHSKRTHFGLKGALFGAKGLY